MGEFKMNFFYLMGKELKVQIKQLPIYVYTILVISFLFSQITLPNKTTRLAPIPISEYLYEHLFMEYKNGKREVYDSYSLIQSGSRNLKEEEKEAYEKILHWLNEDFTREQPELVKEIKRSESAIKKKLNHLDFLLGGDSFYSKRVLNYEIENYKREVYGLTEVENPKLILEEIINRINDNLKEGKYLRYSFLSVRQYRNVTTKNQRDMEQTLAQLNNIKNSEQIKKEEIYRLCEKLDRQLGGSSEYNKKYLTINRNKTYDEAKAYFEEITQKPDLLTNAYARDVADYMGCIAGMLTATITSFILLRDERYHMKSLIVLSGYSIKKYILSKIIATSILLMIPYMLYGTFATIKYKIVALNFGYEIDSFAFYKYIMGWILPTILFIVVFTFFLSIVFKKSLLSIGVSILYTFLSFFPTRGDYSFYRYIIRMNGVCSDTTYSEWKTAVIGNRLFYLFLSGILFVGITLWFQRMERESEKKQILRNKIKRFGDRAFEKNKSCHEKNYIGSLIFYQWKINFRWNIILAFIIPFLAPLFWGIQVLRETEVIGMSEMFLPLSSIFLFVNIGRHWNSQEEFYIKNNWISAVLFFIQFGIAVLLEIIIFGLFYKMLLLNGANFDQKTMLITALLASIYIGMIGNVICHFTGDIRLGFLIAMAYYFLEFTTKGSITGVFYIFYPLEQRGNGWEVLVVLILCLIGIAVFKRKEIRGRNIV